MGQKPITFIRQVLALVSLPELLDDPRFPNDAKDRAKEVLAGCQGGSVGSYTDSPGIETIRRNVAKYIENRDGIPSNWENILLCAGASDGIKSILKLFINKIDGKYSGVMVPIPQYPLYSATIAEFNMHQIGYYLDESKNWELDIKELQRALDEARKVCNPCALVVINPGNPTGQVLSRQNIEEIIKFAYKEKLFLLADEVYQDNVYAAGSKFFSFKKVMVEMGPPYDGMELASFMSCSKGYMGECGVRGGYSEVLNLEPEVKTMLLKSISAMLCPTVLGQLEIPKKACERAASLGQQPDVFYAFQLLEETGICIVPGSGFGQQPGTYHFRTTILPQPELLNVMLDKFEEFHKNFLAEYK